MIELNEINQNAIINSLIIIVTIIPFLILIMIFQNEHFIIIHLFFQLLNNILKKLKLFSLISYHLI